MGDNRPTMPETARQRYAKWMPLIVLAVINVALVALPFVAPTAPGGDWYKGPLVDPVSPFSPAGGRYMLGLGLAAFLDLSVLLTFVAFTLLRTRLRARPWLFPLTMVVVAAISVGGVELGLRASLATHVKTMFLPDPDLNWRLMPNLDEFYNTVGNETVSTNSLGWRAPEVPKNKAPDQWRGLLLGDSSAYGLGVDEPHTMAKVLENKLAAAWPERRVTVYNAACPGHTTHQGLKQLRAYYERLRPDLVVIAFNNDPALEFFTDRQREQAAAWAKGIQRVLYRSRFFLIVRQVVVGWWRGHALDWEDPSEAHRRAVDGRPMQNRVPLDEYAANLEAMIDFAREKGIAIAFVGMPVNRQAVRLLSRFYDENYPHALLARDGEGGAMVVDINGQWTAEGIADFLPGHIFHPNAAGHRRIGEAIFARLAKEGIATPPAAAPVSTPTPSALTPLRMGYSSLTPLHTAIGEILRRTDLPARHGFAATFEAFRYGHEQAAAIERLDATFTTEVPAIAFLGDTPDWRVIGCTGSLGMIGLVADGDDVSSLADLRGKTIAVTFDSTPHGDLLTWLREGGLVPGQDVMLHDGGSRDMAQELAAGRVEVVAAWDPWISDLRSMPGVKVLRERPFFSLIILRDRFLAQNDGVAARYRALLADALTYAREHRETVVGWVVETSGLKRATVEAVLALSGRLGEGEIDFTVSAEALEWLRRDHAFFHAGPDGKPPPGMWEEFHQRFFPPQ